MLGIPTATLTPDGLEPSLPFTGISTDTRSLGPEPGTLFVALEGERFDGHDYLAVARGRGATGAVVKRGTAPVAGLRLLEVDSPLEALGALAAHARRAIDGPVIAITGSNGKTSTKELVAAALGTRYRTHATTGNLNNLIGVPLTLLGAPADTEALVVEAGASVPGEIARYREIIQPTMTIITNVGASHLEGFGSIDAVLGEKLELGRGVPLVVVGPEPEDLAAGARRLADRVVVAGLDGGDLRPDSLRFDPLAPGHAVLRLDNLSFTLPAPGRHMAANAMLAWAVVRELGLEPLGAAAAIEEATLPGGRGQLRSEAGLRILDDCYNANPDSFRAAIATAGRLREGRETGGGSRLIWVVGTMRELGPASAALHRAIARELIATAPSLIAATGEFVAPLRALAGPDADDLLVTAPDVAGLGAALAPRLEPGDLVVLKASRGVALEGILPYLVPHDHSPDG